MNDVSSIHVGQVVADILHGAGKLPPGSFVDGYLVLVKVVDLDGAEQAAWITSQGFGVLGQIGLLRKVQMEIEQD